MRHYSDLVNPQGRNPGALRPLDKYVAVLGSVIPRHEAELALRAANRELSRALGTAQSATIEAQGSSRAMSEFLANMSHELRTPLNAIIGFSEFLLLKIDKFENSEKEADYIQSILESARLLLSIINDILDISKIESGTEEVFYNEFVVAEMLGSCERLINPRAEQNNIDLKVLNDEPDLSMIADERKTKQVLLNILSNAVKFTPKSGSISLYVRKRDKFVIFETVDSGVGMTSEQIKTAAQPFRQVDSKLSRKGEGTGLGLPLAIALTEIQGGKLTITSEPGQGTAITVAIPVKPAEGTPIGKSMSAFDHKDMEYVD